LYYEILEAFRTLATSLSTPYTTIEHGIVPHDNGLSIYIGLDPNEENDFEEKGYLDGGGINSLAIVLKGKNSNLQTLLNAMSNIHTGMLSKRPSGENWEVIKIGTVNPPNCIGLDDSGQWLYSSIFRIKFYYKGSR